MADFKKLLNIKPQKAGKYKNKLRVYVNWDSNDADYIGKTEVMDPKVLFNCEKLIYCLAYITLPYNFKGHDWNAAVFDHYIPENCDIDDLYSVICDNDFMCYSDWGPCHSLEELSITYYDKNGIPFDVNFNDIHKRWEKMSYQEICDEINNIKWIDPYNEDDEEDNEKTNLYPLKPAGS